jgi:hypothetical protein
MQTNKSTVRADCGVPRTAAHSARGNLELKGLKRNFGALMLPVSTVVR